MQLIGTTLDKYEVLQKVGEGGMATVYRGRHLTLDREVAIKVLHPHLSSSTRNRKRFAREARAIEHLRHENILEIFDYSGTDSCDCYIITEFVEGETLSALLERVGRMPSEVTALVGLHLARALDYAHGRGILHRDLKTDNVMIRCDGTVKLMDFGIARFLDESQVTMTGALVGSPAFMSPEQAREGDLDLRSDLFSLGTVLFYLVTGHLPFSGSNPSLILKNIIESQRPPPTELAPDMSARLGDVIERLMAQDRSERYASALDVAADLEAVLAETSVDPARPEWSLACYAEDPKGYQQRLEHHLKAVLLENGRRLLEQGEHLDALRLFNRLLSLDEENPEVLALVQGLHSEPRSRRSTGLLAALAAGVACLTALLVWLFGGLAVEDAPIVVEEPAADQSTAALAQPPVEPPVPAEPEPEPERDPVEPVERVEAPPAATAPTATSGAVTPDRIRPAAASERDPREQATGSIRIVTTPPSWAYIEIEIEGKWKEMGKTRDPTPIWLPAGSYKARLTSTAYEEKVVPFVVGPNPNDPLQVDLVPLPGWVVLDDAFPEDCEVQRDLDRLGTIAQIGSRRIRIPDPNARKDGVNMLITCPDRPPEHRTFRFTGPQEKTFPASGAESEP